MPTYEQNKKAAQKYLSKMDEIRIRIPKESGLKDAIQAAADEAGESVNEYTKKAILARMGLETWPELNTKEE